MSATDLNRAARLPIKVTESEAFLLHAFARMKERRFGRLVVSVSDGRVVDVELTEKIDHEKLRTLPM